MHLLYNGQIILEEKLHLPLTNRAFQYNDGFFETIMMRNGRLLFWQDHVARMCEAAQALKLDIPPLLTQEETEEMFLELAQHNQARFYGRIKLKVWRAGAGLYTPQTNTAEWYASINPAEPASIYPIRVGIASQVRTMYSPLSHFKGPNALLYVLAANEKKELGLDDVLLLSQQGFVAELTSSNIFWIKDQVLYTAALETGCVNGIVRRNILRWCQKQSINLQEVLCEPAKVKEADAVFATNVTGIRSITSIEGHALPVQHPLIEQLQKELFG